MRSSALPLCQPGEVVLFKMMHRNNGLAPLLSVEAHGKRLLPVEHGPIASKWNPALFQHLRQHFIATALARNIDSKEMGPREMLILAEHAAERHDLIECGAREDVAAPAVCKDGLLLLGPDGRAKVVGRLVVEVCQEAVEVVVVDVRVGLEEDIPLRLGPHVRGPLHHGQELVLVEAPALGRLLVGQVGRLQAVVDVKVLVVEAVLGPQVGEGVGDLEAVVRVLAVREDDEVLLAPSQAVEVGRQAGRDFAGANLEHKGDALHDAGREGRAFLAKGNLGDGAGSGGRGALGEDVVAALAAQQAGDEGGEEEGAQHNGGAQQAQGRQSHHHGGEGALPEDMMFGRGRPDAPTRR